MHLPFAACLIVFVVEVAICSAVDPLPMTLQIAIGGIVSIVAAMFADVMIDRVPIVQQSGLGVFERPVALDTQITWRLGFTGITLLTLFP